MSNEWNNSVWSCFDPVEACFMSLFCPCMIHGKQSERLQDPSLKHGSNINGVVSVTLHPLTRLKILNTVFRI
ncbi:hypothetical protein BDV11DRAFT_169073 [Aspergillus similis]